MESRVGRPFVGPSGHILDTFLSAAAIDRQQIFVTNCVKEFTSYSKPTAEELDRDKPELIAEILATEPEVIALVGAYAVTHVLGWDKADMDRRHGIPVRVHSLFGGELTDDCGWIVVPVYHPANVIHAPEMAPVVLDDYLRLGMILDGEIPPMPPDIPDEELDYRVVTARELESILPPVCLLVGIDTEGSKAKPWSLQFSICAGQSFLIRGDDLEALAVFALWLKVTNPFVSLQNALHDLPVLRAMGIELEDGSYGDTMIFAYLLNVEPQGLKPLAYRHAGMLQESYDDVIGDVGWSIAMEYLCKVADQEWPSPEPEIVYEGGNPKVKKPQGVNKLVNRILDDIAKGKTLKDGSFVDPADRWKKLSEAAKAPVIAAIGDMREPDLDDVPPARAQRYAIRDADAQYRITRSLESRIKAMGLEEVSKVDHDVLPMVDRMMSVGAYMAEEAFWDRLEAACEKQKAAAKYEIFKITGRDLNPGSGDQVADLLYGSVKDGGMGLTPLIMTDGGATGKQRGSTNDKCLEDLMSQAPVVEHIQDYREADKLVGTYVGPLRDAARTPDRRAHTTFKVTRQVTGRITTAEPINLLSIPVRSELGAQCRDGFEAPPGKVMYDADMNQIELRLFAHESQDKNLCKAFIEGIDLHAMTASGMFGVGMGQVEKYQRQAGKICIAEGQLVLTDQGLVPIEKITLRHKLWDGVEWISHDGVVFNGVQEVMEYDGVTATPDHEVFGASAEGVVTRRTLREVASSLDRIEQTGIGGKAVWTRCRDLAYPAPSEGFYSYRDEMHSVRKSGVEGVYQSNQIEDRMQVMLVDQIQVPGGVRGSVRRYPATLQHASLSSVRGLRREGDSLSVFCASRVREVGGGESASSHLPGGDNRSDRQQRSLRARKSAIGDPEGTDVQQAQYGVDDVSGAADVDSSVRQSLRSHLDVQTCDQKIHDGRTDNSVCTGSGKEPPQRVEKGVRVARFARVYDILNAGPRNRFTVSGKLVSNCNFAIINMITPSGLLNQMILFRATKKDGSRWTEDDCARMIEGWFGMYPGGRTCQRRFIEEARAAGYARESIAGRIRYLPNIWSGVSHVREAAERDAQFPIQAGAAAILKKSAKVMWDGLKRLRGVGVEPTLMVHDESLWECPDREYERGEVSRIVKGAFENTVKLRVPIEAEGKFGASWGEAH